ncbi:MAG: HAMP domain-containing histidine kinase [Planctomycetes bacterium]|nr:HAMP domain-containing histidine kinase [Planctomycetota bacterium]
MPTTSHSTQPTANSTGLNVAAFEAVCDAVPVGMSIWDASQQLRYRNPLAQQFFASCNPLQIESVDPKEQRDWQNQLQAIARERASQTYETLRCVCADSVVRALRLAFHPVELEEGKRPGVLLLAVDVTREHELETQLAHAAGLAAVGRLAARVAHELNNPLDGSLRYVNLARRAIETGQTDKIDDYLAKSGVGMKRMAEIISDLLQFSRGSPEAGDDRNVNWIVEESIHMLRESADANGVIVSACLGDEDRMPTVGGTKLLQVCGNLIRNAVDAMPNGGRLNITSGIVDGDIILRFEDSGVGLPADTEQLFKAFYTTKSEGKGTGLGLAICREYVEQLGGTINASAARDGGADFIVRIPLPHGAAQEPKP